MALGVSKKANIYSGAKLNYLIELVLDRCGVTDIFIYHFELCDCHVHNNFVMNKINPYDMMWANFAQRS